MDRKSYYIRLKKNTGKLNSHCIKNRKHLFTPFSEENSAHHQGDYIYRCVHCGEVIKITEDDEVVNLREVKEVKAFYEGSEELIKALHKVRKTTKLSARTTLFVLGLRNLFSYRRVKERLHDNH